MPDIGRVQQIWRFPVKSMQGEALSRCEIGPLGLPGDRGYALRHEDIGEMCGAKKFPVLMQCRASYRSEPEGAAIPPVDIELPGGAKTASDDPEVNARLSDLVGKPVTLWPRQPAEDRDHYRRRAQRDEAGLREVLGLVEGEPLPDFGALPASLLALLRDYTSPLGTYFDAYPVHLLSTGWLAELAGHTPDSRFEPLRFRPNLVIDTPPAAGSAEERAWVGRALRIGGASLRCQCGTVRCSMTVQATGDLPKDPRVLRTLVRESGQFVGTYADVETPGGVSVGDAVAGA